MIWNTLKNLKSPTQRGIVCDCSFFCHGIDSALLIGLGGGAMVHHIHHYWSDQKLDAVEIDPVIVDIGEKLFCCTAQHTSTSVKHVD